MWWPRISTGSHSFPMHRLQMKYRSTSLCLLLLLVIFFVLLVYVLCTDVSALYHMWGPRLTISHLVWMSFYSILSNRGIPLCISHLKTGSPVPVTNRIMQMDREEYWSTLTVYAFIFGAKLVCLCLHQSSQFCISNKGINCLCAPVIFSLSY